MHRAWLAAYPSALLRWRVSGTADRLHYAVFGRECADVMLRIIEQYVKSPVIFDYGCGCGRVLRYLQKYEINGYDIDSRAVRWCETHFAGKYYYSDAQVPPESHNVVTSVSVFSHITADEQRNALEAIGRILSPGGYAILTTHPGKPLYRRSRVMTSYFSTTHGILLDPQTCGFKQVDLIPNGLVGVQDIYILQKN